MVAIISVALETHTTTITHQIFDGFSLVALNDSISNHKLVNDLLAISRFYNYINAKQSNLIEK